VGPKGDFCYPRRAYLCNSLIGRVLRPIFSRITGLAPAVQYPVMTWLSSGSLAGASVMLKIARVDRGEGRTIPALKLEGKILGPWVIELRRACEELHVSTSAFCLDLTDVTFIDSSGLGLIHDLIRQGATLCGCSAFIAELLSQYEACG
jgi:anti-anti-sigma regulatory factor